MSEVACDPACVQYLYTMLARGGTRGVALGRRGGDNTLLMAKSNHLLLLVGKQHRLQIVCCTVWYSHRDSLAHVVLDLIHYL